MKKSYVYFLIIAIVLLIGAVAFIYINFANKSPQNKDYDASRTSMEANNTEADEFDDDENDNEDDASEEENNNDTSNAESDNNDTSSEKSNNDDSNDTSENEDTTEEKTVSATKETEIASFTTKIYTKDSGRQNNITIACSTLNDTMVENGKTFSFSKTVGKATTSKGYKKADVFRNGDVIEALGGGLCQVSTTLYNAVLKIPELKVTERHPHSNKVPYIKSGKDAAVSYGAYDFKFVNNTGNSIKIKADNTKNNVTIKLLKIE